MEARSRPGVTGLFHQSFAWARSVRQFLRTTPLSEGTTGRDPMIKRSNGVRCGLRRAEAARVPFLRDYTGSFCYLRPTPNPALGPRPARDGAASGLAAAFTDGRNVNGRIVFHRALMFADAAANTLDRVDKRPLQLDGRSPAVGDLHVTGEDGFGADRANFFADHATGIHRPGQQRPWL